MKKKGLLALVSILVLTFLDQLVKYIVDANMSVGHSKSIIRGVFAITYVQNKGAAWGSFYGKKIFLLVLTCLVLCLLILVYLKLIRANQLKALQVLLVFLISGALGNIIDRLRFGYVIDMFDFCLINFPVFNVADIYVTCSIFIIFILLMFKYDEKELEALLKKEKVENDGEL